MPRLSKFVNLGLAPAVQLISVTHCLLPVLICPALRVATDGPVAPGQTVQLPEAGLQPQGPRARRSQWQCQPAATAPDILMQHWLHCDWLTHMDSRVLLLKLSRCSDTLRNIFLNLPCETEAPVRQERFLDNLRQEIQAKWMDLYRDTDSPLPDGTDFSETPGNLVLQSFRTLYSHARQNNLIDGRDLVAVFDQCLDELFSVFSVSDSPVSDSPYETRGNSESIFSVCSN